MKCEMIPLEGGSKYGMCGYKLHFLILQKQDN